MLIINSMIQSIIFTGYTKQEAERWLKKYHYKPIKEVHIYLNDDGTINKRRYRLKDPSLFSRFYSKRINDGLTFVMGIY